jgi:tetratricopeptide (TPR) repeat protein
LLLWTKLHEKEKTATLHRKMATVLWNMIGDKEKAKEHHEAALKILETEPESVELARLYEDMGHMLRRMGHVTEALTWVERALGLAEKLKAIEGVANSCIELSLEFGMIGDFKKQLEYANRGLKIALDNDYLETALAGYDKVAASLPSEEYEKRLDCVEKGLALAKKLGSISQHAYFLLGKAGEYALRGELDKAITLGEEAFTLARRTGDLAYIPWYLLSLGEAYQKLGEWDKSEQYCREAVDISRNQNEAQTNSWIRFNFARLHIDKGEYAKAKELLEEAIQIWKKAGARTMQMYNSTFLIWTLIELAETDKAQDLLDSLQKFARAPETGDMLFITNEMALRAILLRAQKRYADSIELFERTLKEWESVKANIWNAYYFARLVLCENARAYLERDQEGDKEKNLNLLHRALEMFQKMGAKKDIEKVEARIAFIETGKVVSKPKPVDRVSTGYADLDKLLNGGIPSDCAVVLTSPSCNERDLLVGSFLETGAKKGEVTFYITIDASAAKALAEESMSNLQLFVCNPEADAIIKSSPHVYTLKGVENLTDISIALTSAIRKLDLSLESPRRICIGLVSDVLLQHHAVETRRWLTALMTKLKSEGFTTLAVIDPQVHPTEEFHAIVGLFDGEISIYEKETEKGLEKFLKIKKMSNQEYLKDELLLTKEDLLKRQ